MRHLSNDDFLLISENIVDAFEESGVAALDVSDPDSMLRKFFVNTDQEDLEVWVYPWLLVRESDAMDARYLLLQLPEYPDYQMNPDGPTIALAYEPDLNMYVGFGQRMGNWITESSQARISQEFLHRGLQEGMAVSRWSASREDRGALFSFRPDLMLDYVVNCVEFHRGLDRSLISNYMDKWSLFDRVDRAMPLLATPEETDAAKKVKKRVRDKNFRKKVSDAYDHRCAITRTRLKLIEAAHIYPSKFPDSNDEVGNGVLLSPTFHRAFDRGLIFLDIEFNMRINERKVSQLVRAGMDDGIVQFRSLLEKKIHLPADRAQWPDTGNIIKALAARKIFPAKKSKKKQLSV